MSKTVVFLLSFLLLGSAYAQEVDPNEWDFGKVKQGKVLVHEFVLKNESDKVLNITNIHTSCGCTVSKAGKESLKPKESTKIKITFNTRGYSGQTKQHAYVNTDSPDNPIIRFIIKAEVVKEVK
ncbi:MAG: DUF1573 domain-containing protein [Candidatus Omnitrophica bacterium]|nr:DUF1573 domain-containing protein [Candidatus Omnitrophota bacterium]